MDSEPRLFYKTKHGSIYHADALDYLATCTVESIDLIMTSHPFGLVRKKEYGNVDADHYVEWFKTFAEGFRRVLKPKGSLVIDIGGAWGPGQPSRSLYQYELGIMLWREMGFHLAQELFWWSPSKLPSPAEWVTVRRIRVKDAVNCVWWLSPTPWPKASDRRVPAPYSRAMIGGSASSMLSSDISIVTMMEAPMPTAARSTADRRPAIAVSITALPISASCAISTGQARRTICRVGEAE